MKASTKYGQSYWSLRTPIVKRPSWPRHRGSLDVEIAIVGGGFVGCATAYACAASGIRVAVLEAERIAAGATAASSGLVLQVPETPFAELAGQHGVRTARHIYGATRRAALDLAALIKRLGIRSDLDSAPSLKVAISSDDATRLQREVSARRAAGLDAVWIGARRLQDDVAIDGRGAILSHGDGRLDPVRTTLGLARAAADRGAQIFERSAVRRMKPARRWIDLVTEGGSVRAEVAIVATGTPSGLFDPLERHFKFFHGYLVVTEPLPASVRRQIGRMRAIVRDSDVPPHHVAWVRDERLIVAGADQAAQPDRRRPKAIVQRTGQLMYELSRLYPAISGLPPAYGWDAAYARTADGIPFIGPHRNYPRHLFALGFAPGSLAQAFLAARVLLRAHTGTPDASDQAFAFTRLIA